ncbi:unnamed protein product [Moneuplotes crassus]|uniref:Uncharacterized protein n=1 Tax=Euplotes crassus TaxID=5936 RepID=A0AAD2DAX3_EUPCR|nr:unnamed protein product [Moneuplotes crassus]
MKPCFTKLCTAQRQVFCPDHKAILCYGCKDKLHTKCQVDEIVNPDRVQANITHLERVLETMSKDNQRLEIETHIQGVPGFIKLYKSKIANTEAKLVDSVSQDRFLEYGALLKHILDIWSNIKESEVYQKYCSLMVDFVASYNLGRQNELESAEEHNDTEASLPNSDNTNATQKYLDEFSQGMPLEKLYEKVMECDLGSEKVRELEINLNIAKDVKLVDEILINEAEVKNLKCLTIQNCDKSIFEVCELLNHPLLSRIDKLKLHCDEKCPWEYCQINPILPALASAVQLMKPKEVHLKVWEFTSDDFSEFMDKCSDVEAISAQQVYFDQWNGFKPDENRSFNTKTLQLSPYGLMRFLPETLNSILEGISKCKLKDSLKKINMLNNCPETITSMKAKALSFALDHINISE